MLHSLVQSTVECTAVNRMLDRADGVVCHCFEVCQPITSGTELSATGRVCSAAERSVVSVSLLVPTVLSLINVVADAVMLDSNLCGQHIYVV